MKRMLLAAALTVAAMTEAAQAQVEEIYTDRIYDQCRSEMGYTGAECACLMGTAMSQLTETQMEYVWVRASRDVENTRRMNAFVGVFQRLDIFLTVRAAARACAPGKPFTLPAGDLNPAEAALIGGAR